MTCSTCFSTSNSYHAPLVLKKLADDRVVHLLSLLQIATLKLKTLPMTYVSTSVKIVVAMVVAAALVATRMNSAEVR